VAAGVADAGAPPAQTHRLDVGVWLAAHVLRSCRRVLGLEAGAQKPIGIVEPLLLYSCPPGGRVLDPFAGSGTTGLVAKRHGIDAVLVEGKPEFAALIDRRIRDDAPLFA
jgi:site-specific DNA-methyltransferase (adenine-specific)